MNMSYGGVAVSGQATPPPGGGGGGGAGGPSSPNRPGSSGGPSPSMPPSFSMSGAITGFSFQGSAPNVPPSAPASSPMPPSFSVMPSTSSSFSFQGSSANLMPLPASGPPSFPSSSGFSFPASSANPPPSSGPSSSGPPPLFPLSGVSSGFTYGGSAANASQSSASTSTSLPSSAPPFPRPTMGSGFSFQGSSGNPLPPSKPPSFNIPGPASGFSGQGLPSVGAPSSGSSASVTPSPISFPLPGAAPGFSSTSGTPMSSAPGAPSSGAHMRPLPPALQVTTRPPTSGMPLLTSQASQGPAPGGQASALSMQSTSMQGVAPPAVIPGSGTPAGMASASALPPASSSPHPPTIQGSAATTSVPGAAVSPTSSTGMQNVVASISSLQSSVSGPVPSSTPPGTVSASGAPGSGIQTVIQGASPRPPTPPGAPPTSVVFPTMPGTSPASSAPALTVITSGAPMRPAMPGAVAPPGVPGPQLLLKPTQPNQGQGPAHPAGPAPVATPPAVVPSSTVSTVQAPVLAGIPGQISGNPPPASVAPLPLRPGQVGTPSPVPAQLSPARPFGPPRPVYPSNPGGAAPLVPPGVLGSAPAGMAPRFSASQYTPMVRPPSFPPRLPLQTVSAMPLPRPPGTVLRPGPLLKFPLGPAGTELGVKVVGPLLLPEKPQTTVYVGKIASTVEDEFLRTILELCGPIKSWKRAQDPTSGTPKGFGFCEFESAEGVLRALRILNKFSLEGQELVLNVNQATREYLERYVQKKTERERQLKEAASQVPDTEVETAPGVEVPEPVKQPVVEAQKNDASSEEPGTEDNGKRFGIVNDEDKEADEEAQKKLTSMLDERAKLKPLPPPPPLPSTSDAPGKSNSVSEAPAKSRDGDSVADGGKTDGHEEKNEEETSENKASSELDRPETSSSDRGRRLDSLRGRDRDKDRDRDRGRDRGRDRDKDRERDRDKDRDRDRTRDRERDRERELKREKERELERFERDRERERARREKEREMRLRDTERLYEERERWWEEREKERERQRNIDREREKEREKDRRREIKDQEEESDDEGWRKRRHRGETYDDRRKRFQREKEDDEEDRLKEEQEILEAKRRKIKEEIDEASKAKHEDGVMQTDVAEPSAMVIDGEDDVNLEFQEAKDMVTPSPESKEEDYLPNAKPFNLNTDLDGKANNSAAPRKLGFGLVGSGKRAVVPSLFNQEDEEEGPKDRILRPLVPIDYSAEEMQVVTSSKAATPKTVAPNLAAAAEFAKSLSNLGNGSSREEMEFEQDRARRQRDRSREKEKNYRERDEDRSRDKDRERGREEMDKSREKERDKYRISENMLERDRSSDKLIIPDSRKLLDAKQLIDTIPKTKEELFAYSVDWAIYDQHDLHERMRPWISKKITEFLGEEEATLVDFIVSNTRKHVTAAHMLELLENILDDEAEMFVLKMWRMLIFEIRKLETGLSSRPKV